MKRILGQKKSYPVDTTPDPKCPKCGDTGIVTRIKFDPLGRWNAREVSRPCPCKVNPAR